MYLGGFALTQFWPNQILCNYWRKGFPGLNSSCCVCMHFVLLYACIFCVWYCININKTRPIRSPSNSLALSLKKWTLFCSWFLTWFLILDLWFHCDIPWWRHQMETFSALLAICAGNSPVTGEFPAQRPVTRSFDVFCAWINGWVNNLEANDLRRYRAHYDVTVMQWFRVIYYSILFRHFDCTLC